jgi:integrase
LPENLLGARDAALLLMGFAGAFRRSELVGLNWEDVEAAPEGLVVAIRRSKTDPEGRGRRIAIPYGRRLCPVRALAAWRELAGAESGPVFRPLDRHGNIRDQRLSDKAVARVVKRSLEAAGVKAAAYAGHSLRGGFATAAAAGGASERAIMRQTGHRSLPMLRRYIREGSLFTDNAVSSTGL